ncbi:MAG: ribosome small subunit-dependent GTPase A [Bacteroidota bacterium]
MTIFDLGWTPFFEAAFSTHDTDVFTPARIFRQDRQRYLAVSEIGTFNATLLGRLLHDESAVLPAVGDWVVLQAFDADQAVIHETLPRFSEFARKEVGQKTRRQVVAANINTVFLVSGLDNDFNIRRIERYLVQAAGSGAKPVILLNKMDMCADLAGCISEVQRVAGDYPIIPLSAIEGDGIDQLKAHIKPGETVAFLGSSGVGKSSLVNRLVGDAYLKTGAVREDDSRGRHTTSHRELVLLDAGGLVMDTPGMRELQLWGEEEDLQAVFSDIEELAQNCKFRDCLHDTEPGCSVQEALETGTLDADRFASYAKLKKELAYLDRRKDEASIMKARKKDKELGKLYKSVQKNNPKRF